MASQILSPSDIDVSKLEFGAVKLLDSGGKSVPIRYQGRNIMLELPSMNLPYGLNVFDKNGPPKYSVDLSFRGAEDNDAIRAAQEFLESFDEALVDAAVANPKWLKMTNPNRDVIKAFYTPTVKVSKDAQGNPKPYPPTFKVALRKKKDGVAFETDFYNGTTQPLTQYNLADTPLEQILVKRAQATTIVQCTGIWFAGGKFGTTWKAVQMRIDNQPEQIRGPAFRSEAPDIRAFVAKSLGAKAAVPTEAPEDDEDEDQEEVVAAVLPKKPAAVAAPPAAASNTFEDDEVVEPVPVPKKAVKKVAPKAK